MLVLTRKAEEKIVFPAVGITIQVLRVRGNVAKIGIVAPDNVKILRHEVAGDSPASEREPVAARETTAEADRESRHALRNRLHAITLALHVLKRKLELGRCDDSEAALRMLVAQLCDLEESIGERPAGRRLRALLVEDDRNQSGLLAGYLEMCGMDVVTAEDGAAALEALERSPVPDFVLLDMRMPRLDGPQTIERIRSEPRFRGLKVFAVSGSSPAEWGVPTGPRGIDRWFPKPLDPETLVQTLRRELDSAAVA